MKASPDIGLRLAAGFLCMLPWFCAHADTEAEIRYLLSYVENSGCTFERNGDSHDAQKAREHIQRKLDFVRRWAGSRIQTAEDFIELTATQSSVSGRIYTVDCEGVTRPSGKWLNAALEAYRENGPLPGVQPD